MFAQTRQIFARFIPVISLWFGFSGATTQSPLPEYETTSSGSNYRVLLVGDSWTEFFWINRSLRNVFSDQGHGDIWEKGDLTTLSGSTAAEWTEIQQLQTIADELALNPSIDIIQVTLGGNDFLAGVQGNGWYVGITQEEEQAVIDRIISDIGIVIDYTLNLNPEYKVLLSFYDFPNFEESLNGILSFSCEDLFNRMNQPTTLELNQAFGRFNASLKAQIAAFERVSLVDHVGLMQFQFGFPAMNIPPGSLLPPGDPNLPSPIQAMFLGADCIHLNSAGYEGIAKNLWDSYYIHHFCVSDVSWEAAVEGWAFERDIRELVDFSNRRCL